MKTPNIFEKLFGTYGGFISGGRIPLRSNVHGYGKLSSMSNVSRIFDNDRQSPLLGNAQPSKTISGYYSRVSEAKQYELLDISRLAVSFFRDYVNNFLNLSTKEPITITQQDSEEVDQQKTDRINEYLMKDIRIFDYIRDHLDEVIYYGSYYSMLRTDRDESGHIRFHIVGLFDPIAVVVERIIKDNKTIEQYLVKGDDNTIYVIPDTECFYLGTPTLRLKNDIGEEHNKINKKSPWEKKKLEYGKQENRYKVIQTKYYQAGEPLFYSNLLKVKELVVKELLISLLSLRDLCTPSLLALMFDRGVPMENAEELCSKVQRMMSSYNDLSSFLTAQFDVTSLIENILSQNVKVIPDYNATIQNKGLITTDKLGDKLMELMQTLDQSRQNVLSTLGIPASILDSQSGNKWQILQSSERANSRVNAIITGIKESVIDLVRTIYKVIYNDEIDPSQIKLHIFEKTTVEYNNAQNTIESVSNLINGLSQVLQAATQTLDATQPLLDNGKFISYIQNMIKDADPNASDLITEETINNYIEFSQQKFQMQKEQMGMQ